jgi:Protein of unknown function (DUF3153)
MVETWIEKLTVIRHAIGHPIGQSMATYWQRASRLAVLVIVAVGLSGCVDGQVGITFDSPHSGQVVQHIKLDTPLAQSWLQDLEQRAQASGGQVVRKSAQALDIVLPFTNAADLERRFNGFFNAASAGKSVDALPISSHLAITASNLILWQRFHLTYDLDLSALGLQGSDGKVLVSPGDLVDLDFGLTTPGGARSSIRSDRSDQLVPPVKRQGHQLNWQLQPGQKNHLEAWFWMPNPLGWGALGIALLIVVGTWLQLPAPIRSSPK